MARILLIDDDQPVLEGLGRLLMAKKHQVNCAANPWEAILTLGSSPVDLIVLDQQMPGMQGGEFLTQLRADERFSSIPVIIMSGLDEQYVRSLMDGQDVQRVLTKGTSQFLDGLLQGIKELCPNA